MCQVLRILHLPQRVYFSKCAYGICGQLKNVGVFLLEGGVCKVMHGNYYPYPRAFAIQSLQSRYGAPPLEARQADPETTYPLVMAKEVTFRMAVSVQLPEKTRGDMDSNAR